MPAKVDSNQIDVPWVRRLGRLRPWEIIDLRDKVADQTGLREVVRNIAKHVIARAGTLQSFHDIDEVLLIASDVRAIFAHKLSELPRFNAEEPAWVLFIHALNGATFQELEQLHNVHLQEVSSTKASSRTANLTTDVVSSYVRNNSVPRAELPNLINEVHTALLRVGGGTVEVPVEAPKPAIPVKKSVTPDYIVCLEDGKKFKSLKRHLRTQYNITPEQYREKWGLPADYPMVAPNYAKARSKLAKEMGLGQKQKRNRRSRPSSERKSA